MFSKRSSLGGRKVSPPQPTCMTAEQKSSYLEGLRNSRPTRPGGSRPAPFAPRKYGSLDPQPPLARSDSLPSVTSSHHDAPELYEGEAGQVQSPAPSEVPPVSSVKGRPLAQSPGNHRPVLHGRKVSPTAAVHVPQFPEDRTYVESTTRKLEKEEAHSLREALERIDHKDEETRVYKAAQDEAADLVWKHRNPGAAKEEEQAPYRNPDLKSAHRRRSSGLRQTSGSRKVSFPTTGSQIYEEPQELEVVRERSIAPPPTELPLRVKSPNKLPWLRKKHDEKLNNCDDEERPKFNRFEIHKNPPTQSRNADYTSNTPPRASTIDVIEEVDTPQSAEVKELRPEEIRAATSMKRKDRSPNLPTPTAVSDQLGRPIVSFNKAWKPTADSPRTSREAERLVVRRPETSGSSSSIPARPLPEVSVSAPAVPTVNVYEGTTPSPSTTTVPQLTICPPPVPTISLPEDCPTVPTISIQAESEPRVSVDSAGFNSSADQQQRRPLPKHSSTAPPGPSIHKSPPNRLPWLPRNPGSTVSCSSCALPISGRIVTASGSNANGPKARFHPECFSCHHCSTPLECVSFYPEPDANRAARLAELDIVADSAEAANDPLRFYCHLDFHEFFSPRCRSCKTPIEGEVVIAAGAEWHVGHFFCAECGDPFDSNTPFVERDNYAYCVRCHTKRTSARCRECKQQILDELTVEALGGKYHEKCFVCYECGEGFGDDGRFFTRDVQVKPTDKEMRKGITQKIEEKAVCGPCEERRLKA